MIDSFLAFISKTNLDNFLNVQNQLFAHEQYDPYSDDVSALRQFLDEQQYSKVAEANNINLLLSPRAHMFKNYAYGKLGLEDKAQMELIIAHKIMAGIEFTGDGSKTKPYKVCRVSDERDLLLYLDEEVSRQNLIHEQDIALDLITCESGKQIYFDITTPYMKLQELMNNHR